MVAGGVTIGVFDLARIQGFTLQCLEPSCHEPALFDLGSGVFGFSHLKESHPEADLRVKWPSPRDDLAASYPPTLVGTPHLVIVADGATRTVSLNPDTLGAYSRDIGVNSGYNHVRHMVPKRVDVT